VRCRLLAKQLQQVTTGDARIHQGLGQEQPACVRFRLSQRSEAAQRQVHARQSFVAVAPAASRLAQMGECGRGRRLQVGDSQEHGYAGLLPDRLVGLRRQQSAGTKQQPLVGQPRLDVDRGPLPSFSPGLL